jgi:hypothetical protein
METHYYYYKSHQHRLLNIDVLDPYYNHATAATMTPTHIQQIYDPLSQLVSSHDGSGKGMYQSLNWSVPPPQTDRFGFANGGWKEDAKLKQGTHY